MQVELSKIEIVPVAPCRGLVAFATFVVNDAFSVGDVGIYTRPGGDGYRLSYPEKTLRNGAKVAVFRPLRQDVGRQIEEQVSEAYRQLLQKVEEERRSTDQETE